MILHGAHYRDFDIRQEDTLEDPQHEGMLFEAIVANPPFSAKWSANKMFESDDRFSEYGKLAPSSKADFAFVQHMLHHLDEDGTMAVVLPHGVLFRGGAEGAIREFLVGSKNWLDAVIGLPANIFYGTGIPTCILVFKKCKEREDVLFVEASSCFEKGINQNNLRDEDVGRIVDAYRLRAEEEGFSHRASLDEIRENDFNLNILRYVDTFVPEPEVDLMALSQVSWELETLLTKIDVQIGSSCAELNINFPATPNLPLLVDYKRGVMQRLFSRELRFTQDDGSAFPDWKNKVIGDVLAPSRITGSKGDVARKISVQLWARGVRATDRAGSASTQYYVRRAGQFIYSKLDFLNCAFGIIPDDLDGMESTTDLPAFDFSECVEPQFLVNYVIRREFYEKYGSTADGSRKARRIQEDVFMGFPILLPHPDEQRKIADLLSAIDAKIEALSTQISEMETFNRHSPSRMPSPAFCRCFVPQSRFFDTLCRDTGVWRMA